MKNKKSVLTAILGSLSLAPALFAQAAMIDNLREAQSVGVDAGRSAAQGDLSQAAVQAEESFNKLPQLRFKKEEASPVAYSDAAQGSPSARSAPEKSLAPDRNVPHASSLSVAAAGTDSKTTAGQRFKKTWREDFEIAAELIRNPVAWIYGFVIVPVVVGVAVGMFATLDATFSAIFGETYGK